MTYIQHDKIVKKINSRDGNDDRFKDNYLQKQSVNTILQLLLFHPLPGKIW